MMLVRISLLPSAGILPKNNPEEPEVPLQVEWTVCDRQEHEEPVSAVSVQQVHLRRHGNRLYAFSWLPLSVTQLH